MFSTGMRKWSLGLDTSIEISRTTGRVCIFIISSVCKFIRIRESKFRICNSTRSKARRSVECNTLQLCIGYSTWCIASIAPISRNIYIYIYICWSLIPTVDQYTICRCHNIVFEIVEWAGENDWEICRLTSNDWFTFECKEDNDSPQTTPAE